MSLNKLSCINKGEKKKMVGEALTQVPTDYFAWRVGRQTVENSLNSEMDDYDPL